MTQIDSQKRYEIGRMKKDSLDQPETGDYLYTPIVLTGEQLNKFGIMTWNEFFESAPPNFQLGRLYHVFESRSGGDRKLVAMGTITSLRNPNNPTNQNVGLNDDNKQYLISNQSSNQNIKFFKDQLLEKDAEIKRLNNKIDELTKDLIKSKEDKIFAEQELRQHIGLNDAIIAKEDEYMKAIEKAQKEQSESSNKVMEGIMALATQGLQLWMHSQQQKNDNNTQPINNTSNATVPMGDPLKSMNDGDTIQIKNKNGEPENWSVKTIGDKKVIVHPDGRMKSFS